MRRYWSSLRYSSLYSSLPALEELRYVDADCRDVVTVVALKKKRRRWDSSAQLLWCELYVMKDSQKKKRKSELYDMKKKKETAWNAPLRWCRLPWCRHGSRPEKRKTKKRVKGALQLLSNRSISKFALLRYLSEIRFQVLTAIYPRFTHESGTIRKKQAIDGRNWDVFYAISHSIKVKVMRSH